MTYARTPTFQFPTVIDGASGIEATAQHKTFYFDLQERQKYIIFYQLLYGGHYHFLALSVTLQMTTHLTKNAIIVNSAIPDRSNKF